LFGTYSDGIILIRFARCILEVVFDKDWLEKIVDIWREFYNWEPLGITKLILEIMRMAIRKN
jgi:hypothetical protein